MAERAALGGKGPVNPKTANRANFTLRGLRYNQIPDLL